MGSFLHDNFSAARLTFEEASDAISIDLKKLCFTGSAEELALTANTQPALLTVSIATARVLLKDFGVQVGITAGHSIGEYASLVLAQTLKFNDAIRAVRLRGEAMQSAVPLGQGGMTATLGLNEEQVQYLCDWAVKNTGFSPVSPANYNCDGQIVISGNMKILEWLKTNFRPDILPGEPKRAKLIPLMVSAPFHCSLMQPAQDKMQQFLKDIPFENAKIQIIQNVNAEVVTQAESLKKNLIEQISAPVKWTQSMHLLKSLNVDTCFEVGHGSVLKGLLKKIDGEYFKVYSTASLEDLKIIESTTKLLRSLD